MRVLVFAHRLELGGTQTNAIELAAAIRDRFDHQVLLFGIPGPAVELARQHRLAVLGAPEAGFRPSAAVTRALREAVAEYGADLVHAWDWPQVLEAHLGLAMVGTVPVVGTSMSMVLERFLPRSVPMTFGTEEVSALARASWKAPVVTLEPPVDVEGNRPGAADGEAFCREWGIDPRLARIVVVSRLARSMKLESVLDAVAAVEGLACPATLVVVGDGDGRPAVEDRGRVANRRLGRRAVVVTGPMVDPRPAYAAADIVLGMGGSALRAMAFARPVVVVGEGGFARVLDEESAGSFLWSGFYGVGGGGSQGLVAEIGRLVDDPDLCHRLGVLGRSIAVERFGLERAAERLEAFYRLVAEMGPAPSRRRVAEGVRSVAIRSLGPLRARARARTGA